MHTLCLLSLHPSTGKASLHQGTVEMLSAGDKCCLSTLWHLRESLCLGKKSPSEHCWQQAEGGRWFCNGLEKGCALLRAGSNLGHRGLHGAGEPRCEHGGTELSRELK